MDLSCENIKSFIYSRDLSHNTRLSHKSHMQRLLRIVSYLDPSFGIQYIQLRDLNIRRTSRDNAPRRKPRVLSRDECQQLLTVWKNEETHKGIRNHAVICLLLYSAIGNGELVALRWNDLNWDAQTLSLSRDNEGQGCSVPILDASPNTINALRRLQDIQRSIFVDHDIHYIHIFPALSTGKEARFKPNKNVRTSTQTIRNIVKQTAEQAGLGKLSSLDLRHTSLSVFSKADLSHVDMSSSANS
jgi:integrase